MKLSSFGTNVILTITSLLAAFYFFFVISILKNGDILLFNLLSISMLKL